MRRIALAIVPLLAACAGDPAAPRWEERDAVKLNGIYYLLADDLVPPGTGPSPGLVAHSTVLRHVPCDGVRVRRDGWGIQDPCGLNPGDANVLAAGIALDDGAFPPD